MAAEAIVRSDVRADIWADVVGQDRAVAALQAAAVNPVHAYLLVGPAGAGKRAAAVAFATTVLAADAAERGADVDRSVALALAENHPDLTVFAPQGASLSVDDADDITKAAFRSPVEGGRKVLVLTEFHTVAVAGPALLKTIEEPPPSTVFVILAEEVPPELVAIASRAVRIDLGPVPETAIARRLCDEGVDADVAASVASAAAGDLARARLLVTDGSLAVRRQAWASIPHRVDGTGATAAMLVDEVRAHIDAAQEPLDERQRAEVAAQAELVETYGTSGRSARDVEAGHKREVRRHRTAELRFGLAVVSRVYRDHLVAAPDPAPYLDAIDAMTAAAEALTRYPNELLLLQALVAGFPPVTSR